MREAGINPSAELLWEAADLAYDKSDPGLKAVLRQVAPSVVGPNHPLIRRLSGGSQLGSSMSSNSDRWRPRKGGKDSGSRASGSSSVRPDSWRPTTAAGAQESGGEDEQVAQQAKM